MTGALCLARSLGVLCLLVGQLGCLVALCIPQWLTVSSGLLENEKYMLGLWEACVVQDTGQSVCQASGQGDLAAEMVLVRILMCVACGAGSLGLVLTLLGLTWLRCGGRQGSSLESSATVAGGGLTGFAGLTTLAPVSFIAHVTVQKFWGPGAPTHGPRWEYGNALFIGWMSGFALLTGGLLLVVSQLYANKLAEKTTPLTSEADYSRKVHFAQVGVV